MAWETKPPALHCGTRQMQMSHKDHFSQKWRLNTPSRLGPSCVATTLAMIARTTGAEVEADDFKTITNSQSPHSWSNALKPYGMQLAYCNHDLRRIEHYIDELVKLNDLFFLVLFTRSTHQAIPDGNGKLCTAHIVTMHNDTIYDTAKHSGSGGVVLANQYERLERQTKRIFRVVPLGHPRCV